MVMHSGVARITPGSYRIRGNLGVIIGRATKIGVYSPVTPRARGHAPTGGRFAHRAKTSPRPACYSREERSTLSRLTILLSVYGCVQAAHEGAGERLVYRHTPRADFHTQRRDHRGRIVYHERGYLTLRVEAQRHVTSRRPGRYAPPLQGHHCGENSQILKYATIA